MNDASGGGIAKVSPASLYSGYGWYDSVKEAFAGIPEWLWGSIIGVESGGNPNALGDGGKSYGLFQLFTAGGLGDAYRNNPAFLFDPAVNARIAADAMRPKYEEGVKQGLTGFNLLEYVAANSGWPLQTGNMPTDYKAKLQQSYSRYSDSSSTPVMVSTGTATGSPSGNVFQALAAIESEDVSVTNLAGSAKKIAVMVLLVLLGLVFAGVGLLSLVGFGGASKIIVKSVVGKQAADNATQEGIVDELPAASD